MYILCVGTNKIQTNCLKLFSTPKSTLHNLSISSLLNYVAIFLIFFFFGFEFFYVNECLRSCFLEFYRKFAFIASTFGGSKGRQASFTCRTLLLCCCFLGLKYSPKQSIHLTINNSTNMFYLYLIKKLFSKFLLSNRR